MADNERIYDQVMALVRAMRAADETFDDTPEGNAKFRDFTRRLLRPIGVAPLPPDPMHQMVRYGVPY